MIFNQRISIFSAGRSLFWSRYSRAEVAQQTFLRRRREQKQSKAPSISAGLELCHNEIF